MLALGASAQYTPTEVGTVLKYKSVATEPENVTKNVTLTVDSVYAEGDLTRVRILNHIEIPGSFKTEPEMYTFATYNPNNLEAPTTQVLMDPDAFRQFMVSIITEGAAQEGQTISDSDMEEILKLIRPSGKLVLPLDPTAAVDSKIPNASLRISVQMMTVAMHISNGKYLGKESVTVPAGTFDDCIKVSYVFKQNAGPENSKEYITAWYAPGVGLVKEITANKKGAEIGKQELLSVTRP